MLRIIQGDALTELAKLEAGSVHCCVTSPPYWGLRDYGVAGQIGLEKTPEEYVAKMVEVFREVRRVLREDGTCWVNMGDSYANANGGYAGDHCPSNANSKSRTNRGARAMDQKSTLAPGLKQKDLCGIPWRLAFALQADGWWLRQDIIWHKPNPMPESVTDRCTKSHEYLFLLTKSARYFFDSQAIKESANGWNGSSFTDERDAAVKPNLGQGPRNETATRNKRSVWTVPSSAYSEAHFATFPPDLIKPCILAGTSARGCCPNCGAPWERVVEIYGRKGRSWHDHSNDSITGQSKSESAPEIRTETTGWESTCLCANRDAVQAWDIPGVEPPPYDPTPCTVLDPFAGSGTTGMVALELGRKAVLIELNPKYIELAKKRCHVTPGLPLA